MSNRIQKLKLAIVAAMMLFLCPDRVVSAAVSLKLERFNGLDASFAELPGGVVEIHGADLVRATPLAPVGKGSWVLEMEYFCAGDASGFTAIPGPPFESKTARSLPELAHSETWSTYAALLNPPGKSLPAGWQELRLELSQANDSVLQIRNARLRPALRGEFDVKRVSASPNAAATLVLEAYLNREFSNEISTVTVGVSNIAITGKFSGDRRNLFLGHIPMEYLAGGPKLYDSLTPVVTDAQGGYSVTVPRVFPRDGRAYDRLTSRWQLFRRTATGYEALTHARYADEVACRFPQLPPAKPASKKGLGGWALGRLPGRTDELNDLGITAVTVNIFSLHQFVALTPEPDTTPFTWQGRTYYAREQALAKYDQIFLEAEKHGVMVSAILLVDNPVTTTNAEAKLLGHPDAVKEGKYAMPNVTLSDGIAYYGAILNLIAERWSHSDGVHGRVHHWIAHNEVDFGWVWTNAGKKSDLAYMDLYQRSLRLIHLIVRQYDPNARAFISLTHHWANPGNQYGYGSKRLLELLLRFCRAEGDFPWALAYHPYPQNLFNPRTWEDEQATFDFNSPKITPRNLEVLDAYMKLPALRYRGEVRPVHLSENGFNSKDYSPMALEDQAAGMALAWKKMVGLTSIESWQYHNWIDGRWEGGLKIGLRRFADDPDDPLGKKPIWYLYQALGTPREDAVAAPYLKTIGISSWDEVIYRGPISGVGTSVKNLRCENLLNPLGVDVAPPRFGWQIESDQRGERQTAYQVLVASTPEKLAKDQGDFWDSGKIGSAESIQIAYAGQPLHSAESYCWKVRVWDQNGSASRWSEPATFTMGLFTKAEWHSARWISFRPEAQWRTQWEQSVAAETNGVEQSFPWLTGQGLTIWEHYAAAHPPYDASPLFRKEFKLDRLVRRATLYICGLGYCEAFLNGQKIGDQVLDPAWTCYQKRAFYVTYNVTAQLKPGRNALGAMLGRGQFSPLCNDIWGLRRAEWVDQPRLIARLNVTYADGTSQDLVTDSSWRTAGGPIIYDDTRHGEIYDARREQPGWNAAGFDESKWQAATEVNAQNPLQAQLILPIREFPVVEPVRCIERSKHEKLFDAGRNLAGWARVTVHGAPGAKVLVDYAEVPFDPELRGSYPAGKPAPGLAHPEDNFRDLAARVRQQNGYILKGGGAETFTCHFSYKGFQFIRVLADEGVSIDQVQAVPVHSDVATVGEFECSNPLLNQIQQAARLTFLKNFHSIQTDCPHREKQGWTADLYLTAEAAMFNFDLAAFYAKCVADIADTQNAAGGVGLVAPSGDYNLGASTLWPAAMVYVPADLLKFYGDRRTMAQHYEAMKRFANNSLLRQVPGKPEVIADVLGDWASPLDQPDANGEMSVMSPPEGRTLYGTAAHFRVITTLAQLARELGKTHEAREFDDWARRIAEAFNHEYFAADENLYRGERAADYRQAANAVPLDYGLVPASAQDAVLGHLVENVHIARGDRLNTGFVGTPSLLNVLAQARPEVAYALAAQTNYPSWGWMMKSGGTTIYEQFGGDNSHDHPMFGCISAYFYQHLAGIQPDPAAPGFSHFFIQPGVVGDLTWVRSHFDSPHGRIVSNWKLTGGKLTMNVTIPAGTTATVYVPAWPGKPGESLEDITESGKPIASVAGVKFLKTENGSAVLAVESGAYEFAREWKNFHNTRLNR